MGLWSLNGTVELEWDCGAEMGLWSWNGTVELEWDCGDRVGIKPRLE